MTSFKIVIPARYASTRLPGKPLLKLNGISLIEHVYNAAKKTNADEIIVATDNKDIFNTVTNFGGYALMTGNDHVSGTDRIHEAAKIKKWDPATIVVNLQGDEPLVSADSIHSLVDLLAENNTAAMSTLASPISDIKTVIDPNTVKVVLDSNNFALYFSRAPIPWLREHFSENIFTNPTELPSGSAFYAHIGLYAYRVQTLQKFSSLLPSPLEQAESLEQLRILSNGMKIQVAIADNAQTHGVDTADDLVKVEQLLNK